MSKKERETRPIVLFVCVHNAGRSQMAAGFMKRHAGSWVEVLSAGTEPAAHVNPIVLAVMGEKGIDLSRATPTLLSDSEVRAADVVVTMGCGDACPIYPGKRYEDWQVADPAGKGIEQVRLIRDEIEQRVERLAASFVSNGLKRS